MLRLLKYLNQFGAIEIAIIAKLIINYLFADLMASLLGDIWNNNKEGLVQLIK